MSLPAIVPIKIIKGDTYRHTFFWKDQNGAPINMTGYTVRMQIRNYRGAGATLLQNVTDITISAEEGRTDIVIDESLTTAWTFRRGDYDVVASDAAGKDITLALGPVLVESRVTA